MTSKSSLWTRWTEDIKRNSWLWGVNIFIFIIYTICKRILFIAEDGYFDMLYNDSAIGDSILSTERIFLIVILAIAAGIQGFSYLHSKMKVDMYHSQPVSERSRFFRIYIHGILCFVIPCVIGCLLQVFVVFCYRDGSIPEMNFLGIALKEIYFGMVLEMLLYFAIYQVAVFMTILTSDVVFSVVCTVTGLFYEIIIRKIVECFSQIFFHTYYEKSEEEIRQCRLSVLHLFEQMKQNICYGMSGKEMLRQLIEKGWWIVFLSIITAVFAYLIYKKRPLENIKMPFAFLWLRTIFKVVLMVPGILIAVYLAEFERDSDREVILFHIFSLLLAAVIGHCILEILFEKDLQAVWKHKKSAIISTGIAAFIFVLFQSDLCGYDRYIPKEQQIEHIALVLYEEEGYAGTEEDVELYEITSTIWDMEKEEYILEHMKLTSIDELCRLAKENCNYTWEQAAEQMNKNKSGTMQQMIVAFHMKNGKTIYRNYYVVSQAEDHRLRKIQQSMEYIQGSSVWMCHENDGNGTQSKADRNLYSLVWIDKKEEEKNLSKIDSKVSIKIREVLKKDI